MKKVAPFLILVILLAPSIASAVWWNPFSWAIFNRDRISTVTNVQTEITQSTEESETLEKENVEPEKQAGENFSPVLIDFANKEIELNKTSISQIDSYLFYVNERIDKNNKSIANLEKSITGNGDANIEEATKIMINLHNSDLEFTNFIKGRLITSKTTLEGINSSLNLDIGKWSAVKTQRDNFLQSIENFKKIETTRNTVTNDTYSTMVTFSEEAQDTDTTYIQLYQQIIDYTDSLLGEISNATTSSYIPPQPVVIKMPQITSCNFNSIDNTFGSTGTVSCHTY